MKTIKRTLAMLLCVFMTLGALSVVASAATDSAVPNSSQTGSITIHKYEYNGTGETIGNGEANQSVPSDAKPLADVGFSLYMISADDAWAKYLNGDSSIQVSNYYNSSTGAVDTTLCGQIVNNKKTDSNGEWTVSGLSMGLYMVVETSSPDKVTSAADPFLVAIPMTKADGSGWLYDVHAYPKNSTSVGNVLIKKTAMDGTTAIQGATFKLEKEIPDPEDEKGGTKFVPVEYDKTTGVYTVIESGTSSFVFTTDEKGEITLNGLPHGTYSIREQYAPGDYVANDNSIQFVIKKDNTFYYKENQPLNEKIATFSEANGKLVITVKNDKPTIEKTSSGDATMGGVGSTVNYQVKVRVPVYTYYMEVFKVTDTPTNLTDNLDSIVVTCGKDTLTKGTHYTVTPKGKGFELEFVVKQMGDYEDKDVVISYSATVDTSAVASGSATNTATLTYTNKISIMDPTTNEIEDTDTVKNYSINLFKKAESENGDPLANVEFELLNSNKVKIVFTEGSGSTYTYSGSGAGKVTTLTTDTNGKIVMLGLPAGTYYLRETKTQQGYNLIPNLIEVNLTASNNQMNNFTLSQTVVNKTGVTLPTTGGVGVLMFIVIGGILMGGGIVLMTKSTKKRAC